eukprot:5577143-Pleurochrysis_carterae.AAC.1
MSCAGEQRLATGLLRAIGVADTIRKLDSMRLKKIKKKNGRRGLGLHMLSAQMQSACVCSALTRKRLRVFSACVQPFVRVACVRVFRSYSGAQSVFPHNGTHKSPKRKFARRPAGQSSGKTPHLHVHLHANLQAPLHAALHAQLHCFSKNHMATHAGRQLFDSA